MFSIFLLDKFSLTSQSSLGRVFSMYHHSPKFFWLCHPNLRQWKSDCSVCTCICCSAYHGRFLHFLWFIVNIKGGSLLVESVLKIPDSPQDEPNHPCCCFPWQRCVSSFSFIVSQDWSECFRLCEEVVRKPKLFFVSTSATTSTLQTASVCYISTDAIATCAGRKRRTISLDGMEPEGAVQPSTFKREVEGESVQDEASLKVNEKREGRFLLYWITTTSISTSTSFTTTFTVSSALCTPAGAGLCW